MNRPNLHTVSLFDLNVDVMIYIVCCLRHLDLFHLALTCRALHDICELYAYRRVCLTGFPATIAWTYFLKTPEGMSYPTIGWLLVDVQVSLNVMRATKTLNNPKYNSNLILCAKNMSVLLAGTYAQLSKLQFFDQGECLQRKPRIANAIVKMTNLVEFGMSRSGHGTRLLKRMRQPLRSLQIGKPGGLPSAIQPPTLPHPANSLADISHFAQTLVILALEESYLSHLHGSGSFPRLRYLHTTYTPDQSRPVQWSRVNAIFPALRYFVYLKEDKYPFTGVERSRAYNMAMDYLDDDQFQGLSLRADCEGAERVCETLDAGELIVVDESKQGFNFSVRPAVLRWFQHKPEDARKTLQGLTRSVPSLKVILFGSLAAISDTHMSRCDGICKGSVTDMKHLLRALPIASLNLRLHSSVLNGMSAANRSSSGPAEAYATELASVIPRLRYISLYILGSTEQQPISWKVVKRKLLRVSGAANQQWRESQLRECSAWAREEWLVELFLHPKKKTRQGNAMNLHISPYFTSYDDDDYEAPYRIRYCADDDDDRAVWEYLHGYRDEYS
ncbi:hypothetical protein PUNSTDRAFT_145693 [Punctularia strigosozonata HHB-11173 SS5]|uniref:uncharacterized protein n=1 Tax=Punctularia strigosozonata (strain HHB-11173) TaxID=741275 RepID=UPI0004417EEE|nr:uncharacterized protein PUNSTDRAFT_145693 [Punctularia strigosozonata HHB-11173 SS5]EIN05762.1 hypothetical protein PUNSTDRAFT_145693 [Punctularia strigosozonata HHB-11173 SS5]